MFKRAMVVSGLLVASPMVAAVGISASLSEDGYFWGGGLGASFGEVDVITLSPMIGKHLTEQISVGTSLNYTHRNDTRYEKKLTTDDVGVSLFSRYQLTPQIFLEGDYEFLSAEKYAADFSTERENYNSILVGGGLRQSLGGNASTYFSALYNLNFDEDNSPYDDPWVVRGGIGFGF